jgi:hypothetical protein
MKHLPCVRWPDAVFGGEWVLYPWEAEDGDPGGPYPAPHGLEFRWAGDGGNGTPLLHLVDEAEARVVVDAWKDPAALPQDFKAMCDAAGFERVAARGFSTGSTELVKPMDGGRLFYSSSYHFTLTWVPDGGDGHNNVLIVSSSDFAEPPPGLPRTALLHGALAVVGARLDRGRVDLPLGAPLDAAPAA